MSSYHLDGQGQKLPLTWRLVKRCKLVPVFAFAALLILIAARQGRAQQDTFDRDSYHRAVDFCREKGFPGAGDMEFKVGGRLALSADRQILCFDGPIAKDMDVSLAKDLKENGLFVVRSQGGKIWPAIELSNIVRERHASVLVYDYCFSACAEFFLIASYQTYVLKGALVAWHNPWSEDAAQAYCNFVMVPERKLRPGPCNAGPLPALDSLPIVRKFHEDRVVHLPFEAPPDSLYVRKMVRSIATESALYRDIGWTLHPRYYPGLFKTKIFYEAYPESQTEVDDMLARLHLRWKVIYDP